MVLSTVSRAYLRIRSLAFGGLLSIEIAAGVFHGHNLGHFKVESGRLIWLIPVLGVCPGRDSNPHEEKPLRILSPVRLPVPPPGPKCSYSITAANSAEAAAGD